VTIKSLRVAVVIDSFSRSFQLARKLGKSPERLRREVDPYDARAKLDVETLLKLMKITQDVRPLEYMARCLGKKIIPRTLSRKGLRGEQGAAR
jgi:hypothetical protein